MTNQAFEDWRDDAKAVSLIDAAAKCGAKLKKAGRDYNGPCPSGCCTKDGFVITPSKQKWFCRGAGEGGGDAIGLVMHCEGLEGPKGFLQACEILTGRPKPDGESVVDPQAAQRRAERREKAKRQQEQDLKDAEEKASQKRHRARRTWAGKSELEGSPAEKYLLGRKLEAWRGIPTLGFHPKVWHDFDRREYPAFLGCAVGPDMKFKNIWRIFIDGDGNKASASEVKMGLGALEGGAVWLATRDQMQDGIWGICEGLETGLAIRELFKGENDKPLPVFAALSRSGLQSFILPPFLKHLSIYPDGDVIKRNRKGEWQEKGDGQMSADKLAMRLKEAGFSHEMIAPPQDSDWNDVLIEEKEGELVRA